MTRGQVGSLRLTCTTFAFALHNGEHQKRCSFLWRSPFEAGVLPQAPASVPERMEVVVSAEAERILRRPREHFVGVVRPVP